MIEISNVNKKYHSKEDEKQSVVNEDALHYNSIEEMEQEKLKNAVFNSDMEKLKLFTRMLRVNKMYKRAIITQKPI